MSGPAGTYLKSSAEAREFDETAAAVFACREYAARLFDELRAETASGPGITRDAYGKGEQFAHDLVARQAAGLNLEISRDAACNTYMTWPGRDRAAPAVIIGSHLDSVECGGNFDGAAGVLSGLTAIRSLKALGFSPSTDISVMAIRAEESVWFETSYIGSRAALGTLNPKVLEAPRVDTGMSLKDHILHAGGRPEGLLRGEQFVKKEKTRAFIEVHIEQAPALVHARCPIGIATGIPGNFRYPNARVIGQYGHVGLHRSFRSDAALAVADIAMSLDRTWEEWDRIGREMAFTMGRVHTNSEMDALTKVAGECRFSLDVRAYNQPDIDTLSGLFAGFISEVETRRSVKFELGPRTEAEPAEMDSGMMNAFENIAHDLGYPWIRLGSPAAHDAAAFSAAGIPIGMVFIRNQNGSHNPNEAMEIDDFLSATAVVACWIRKELAPTTGS